MTVTPAGGRVLGCLVEKELTTPQQYPLTLNALTQACSQSTNREPVMAMDESAVQQALQELKELRLVRFVLPSHGKSVTRFRHVLDEAYGLDRTRVALLAVLLLRGPQTPGELRSRTGRMAEFDSLAAIQGELEVLADQPTPLVRLVGRHPGQKEDRWQQLLATEAPTMGSAGPSWDAAGQPPADGGERKEPGADPGAGTDPDRGAELGTGSGAGPGARRSGLESRIEALESELAAVRNDLREVSASLDGLRRSLGE